METAASWGVFGALQKMTDTFRNILPYLILISFIAGVWIYYLAVSRHEPQDKPLKEWIKTLLRFDWMLWPILGRVLYISLTVFIFLCGSITMFSVNLLGGLVGMTVLLVLVRVLFEMMFILFSIHEHLIQRNEHLLERIMDDENMIDINETHLKAYVPIIKSRIKEKNKQSDKTTSGNGYFSHDEDALDEEKLIMKESHYSEDRDSKKVKSLNNRYSDSKTVKSLNNRYSDSKTVKIAANEVVESKKERIPINQDSEDKNIKPAIEEDSENNRAKELMNEESANKKMRPLLYDESFIKTKNPSKNRIDDIFFIDDDVSGITQDKKLDKDL